MQHGDFLYISDWQIQGIERVNKFTGKDRTVLQNKLDGLMDIRYIAANRQTGQYLTGWKVCFFCVWYDYIMYLSHIRGVVANYLASQAREPGINSHQHQKDSYGAIWEKILCLATICTAGWFSCMVVLEPTVQLACVLGRYFVQPVPLIVTHVRLSCFK